MPLNQTDHGDINWGDYAVRNGWHHIPDPKGEWRKFLIENGVVPYGCYVSYRNLLYVETAEQLAELRRRRFPRGFRSELAGHICPDETATVVNGKWFCKCPK